MNVKLDVFHYIPLPSTTSLTLTVTSISSLSPSMMMASIASTTSQIGATTSSPSITTTSDESSTTSLTPPSPASSHTHMSNMHTSLATSESGSSDANLLGTHLFWHHVVNILDPIDIFGHYAFVALKATATTADAIAISSATHVPFSHIN
ncbi:hypothetical protein IW261DRAFT_1576161 [Armillaria novae-zelandiae]|uniref:Uncharacterized protein n=1 Tax=Armillaria novae-zelandiae TaxID=153914 RepID=A0AA39NBY7_9AGAR|nr:hypothetical protein IW261DRAFT_1576161 [Armillaria novae-zelandiae]